MFKESPFNNNTLVSWFLNKLFLLTWRYASVACVCLSQASIILKQLHGLSWFFAYRFP